MGTSMAFYLVDRRDMTREELSEKMKAFRENTEHTLRARADVLKERLEKLGMSTMVCDHLCSCPRSMLAVFSPESRWVPLFETNLCEGYTASSRDTDRLSKLFGTPVLAFSIFDSDALFVSYSDCARHVHYDYIKPDFPEFEEYDSEQYQNAFPEFLYAYCKEADWERLRQIWELEDDDELFADDRMTELCQLLGTPVLYDGKTIPEGYVKLEID